jgi:glycosyltransferase involved in cell wall biosynthesis
LESINKMSFKISIITPVLNGSKFIEDAIKSVLSQEYEDFEHIIIDGGSTDGTQDIIKKYPHTILISEPDTGQSNAMNKGFKLATGDIIGYLNCDDYYLPGAFKVVVPYFENGADFVIGNVKVISDYTKPWDNIPDFEHDIMLRYWQPQSFCYNPVGYFYLRNVQEIVGGFNEKNHFMMDYEFLLEASSKFKFTKIDTFLGVFRYFKNTKTYVSQNDKKLWSSKSFYFVDRFLFNLPKEFVKQYKKERIQGHILRRKWQMSPILSELYERIKISRNRNKFLYFFLRLRFLIINPDRKNLIKKMISQFFSNLLKK